MNLKKQLKGYYRDIYKQLLCSKSEKKRVLGQLKESVSCFLQENPETDMNAVYESFGTAEEIVEANRSSISTEDIRKQANKRKKVIKMVVISVISVVLAFIIFLVCLFVREFIDDKYSYDVTELRGTNSNGDLIVERTIDYEYEIDD